MFLKNRNIISKIKRSKVTDYAALNPSDITIHHFRNGTFVYLQVKVEQLEELGVVVENVDFGKYQLCVY